MCKMELDLRGMALKWWLLGEHGCESSSRVSRTPTPKIWPDNTLGNCFSGDMMDGVVTSPARSIVNMRPLRQLRMVAVKLSTDVS
jgi:hypothetical protein